MNWINCWFSLILTILVLHACALKATPLPVMDTKEFEGLYLSVYKCTEGKRTIGYGHNLEKYGSVSLFKSLGLNHRAIMQGDLDITLAEAELIYKHDHERAVKDAYAVFPRLDTHPKLVQDTIVDILFNIGRTSFKKFVKTIDAINRRDYTSAAHELKNSKWYGQVGRRSKHHVKKLLSLR